MKQAPRNEAQRRHNELELAVQASALGQRLTFEKPPLHLHKTARLLCVVRLLAFDPQFAHGYQGQLS